MRRVVARGLCLVTPTLILLTSCSPLFDRDPSSSARFQPPPANAPADPGAAPPEVRVHEPEDGLLSPAARPQTQLASWSDALADELDIPRAALQAYGYAAHYVEQQQPECSLSWPLLAGVGAVESNHGRYGGSSLDGTGRPDPPIIGVPLDGSAGVQRIPDTDNGEYDDDPVWDRAVGPLQFIPETWEQWGVDANADGTADPQQIDDAALAAGQYLCDVGGDLSDPEDFWSALLTYNASNSYAQDVLDWADHYGRTSRELFGDVR